ncbi:universal stress protein [Dictyobacter aurantiacus]|uniref:Universal stress protein UspA n=1 Tax=Dictyobacter aurantiacus TaxID=1936993 RepID=A0A401ZI67_9CHLR|nr:universal stress protein [Dictyobacter aurantiacus]GCE06533.1 universal stress protein UspA [Dictyobacter aurantiacus]
MLGHILVPLDGSHRDEQILPMVARLARAAHARVTLITIIALPSEYYAYPMWSGPVPANMVERDAQEAEEHLKHLKQSQMLRDLEVTISVFSGFPVQELEDAIEREHVDLVMMCSHGDVGFKRLVLGSVAQQMVRHSSVPVLILKEQRQGQPMLGKGMPFQFTVALDGSPGAESVLHIAATLSALLSAPEPGKLHLLRVVQPIYAVAPQGNETVSQANVKAMEEAEAYLQDVTKRILLQLMPDTLLDITMSVRTDEDVATALMQVAREDEARMMGPSGGIALATHGRHGVPRWLLGSVTEHVLGHASFPLLIVRQETVEPQEGHGEQPEHHEHAYHPFAMF